MITSNNWNELSHQLGHLEANQTDSDLIKLNLIKFNYPFLFLQSHGKV